MARGSYLKQIANRAVHETRGLRPRRAVPAASPVPPDDPMSARRVPFSEAPAAAPGDPDSPQTPSRVFRVAHVGPTAEPDPGTPLEAATPVTHHGDTGVVPRRDPSAGAPAVPQTAPLPTAGERPAQPSVELVLPSRPEPVATMPTAARGRIAAPRRAPAPPDPLALALAAAVRWASSDERPNAIARPLPREAPSTQIAPRAASAHDGAGETTPPRPPSGAEASVTPPRANTRASEPSVRVALPGRSAPSSAVEATSIHIGSVEVQILAPPPVPPPVAKPAPTARAAPGRLARGLASAIGLRQG